MSRIGEWWRGDGRRETGTGFDRACVAARSASALPLFLKMAPPRWRLASRRTAPVDPEPASVGASSAKRRPAAATALVAKAAPSRAPMWDDEQVYEDAVDVRGEGWEGRTGGRAMVPSAPFVFAARRAGATPPPRPARRAGRHVVARTLQWGSRGARRARNRRRPQAPRAPRRPVDAALFFPLPQTLLHPDAHPDGGLGLVDRALLDAQRQAIFELIKEAREEKRRARARGARRARPARPTRPPPPPQLGRNLLTGNLNVMNLSLPVKMFEPRSYMQKLADVWVYPEFLSRAAATPDPVERLKLISVWFVAGLQYVYASWRKPFNPILGETWAAALADGSKIFMEQVSHHPPVSAFELIGPGNLYTFRGLSQPDVAYKGCDVRTTARGARVLRFADGVLGDVDIAFPTYWMRGIVGTGVPRGEMCGAATFTAGAAGLRAEVAFGPPRGGPPAGADPAMLARGDTVTGTVYRMPEAEGSTAGPAPPRGAMASLAATLRGAPAGPPDPRGEVLATLAGNWMAYCDWRDEREGGGGWERYWTLAVDTPSQWRQPPPSESLESDAARRADLTALSAALGPGWEVAALERADPALVAVAQKAKEALERAQRHDAKLRREGRKAG